MLPGWFGFGSAVQGMDMAELQAMGKEWPFFRTLIQNMEMIMAKADMTIARRYARLVPDANLGATIYGAIKDEWDRTKDAVLRITGQSDLLGGQPELDRLIRLRMPYVEPLNHVQIELIRRRRAGIRIRWSAKAFCWPSTGSRRACGTAARPEPATFCHVQQAERISVMLKWALIFAVIAIVAGLLGFGGIAGAAAGIAKFLAVLALIVFAVFLVLGFTVAKKVT